MRAVPLTRIGVRSRLLNVVPRGISEDEQFVKDGGRVRSQLLLRDLIAVSARPTAHRILLHGPSLFAFGKGFVVAGSFY